MDLSTIEIVLLIISYILGSIPFALVIGKLFTGTDIREHGSGNLGTTNAVRVLGKKVGFTVLFFDVSKAYLILALVKFGVFSDMDVDLHFIFFGIAAIIGHSKSIFLKFKGGKAVAATCGVILFSTPVIAMIGLAVFLLTFEITRYVSIASTLAILSAAIMTHITYISDTTQQVLVYSYWLIFIYVAFKHRANYVRLLNGTENKFERK